MAPINRAAALSQDPVIIDLHGRVSKLEARESEIATELALLKRDMAYLKENVSVIRGGVNKVLWAIALSVVAAATTFVLSGGLAIVKA